MNESQTPEPDLGVPSGVPDVAGAVGADGLAVPPNLQTLAALLSTRQQLDDVTDTLQTHAKRMERVMERVSKHCDGLVPLRAALRAHTPPTEYATIAEWFRVYAERMDEMVESLGDLLKDYATLTMFWDSFTTGVKQGLDRMAEQNAVTPPPP